jgi:hypothetical protein
MRLLLVGYCGLFPINLNTACPDRMTGNSKCLCVDPSSHTLLVLPGRTAKRKRLLVDSL